MLQHVMPDLMGVGAPHADEARHYYHNPEEEDDDELKRQSQRGAQG